MGFRKTMRVESAEVLSSEDHSRVEQTLHRLGKTSAKQLDDQERAKLGRALKDPKPVLDSKNRA